MGAFGIEDEPVFDMHGLDPPDHHSLIGAGNDRRMQHAFKGDRATLDAGWLDLG